MSKVIYMIHHAERGKGPDPSHGDLGRTQLHVARNIMQGLYMRGQTHDSTITPMMPKVSLIVHGTGKRFRETAEKIMEVEEFKNVKVEQEYLLGNEDSVIEEDGKEFVLTGSGKKIPREEYRLISDINNIEQIAWRFVEDVYDYMPNDSCAVFCTGRQFLLSLGLPKEQIKGGCLFRIGDIKNREVLRIIGY